MDRRRRFTIGFQGAEAIETLARRAGLEKPMFHYQYGVPCISYWRPEYVRNDGLVEVGSWGNVQFASEETMCRHLMIRALGAIGGE